MNYVAKLWYFFYYAKKMSERFGVVELFLLSLHSEWWRRMIWDVCVCASLLTIMRMFSKRGLPSYKAEHEGYKLMGLRSASPWALFVYGNGGGVVSQAQLQLQLQVKSEKWKVKNWLPHAFYSIWMYEQPHSSKFVVTYVNVSSTNCNNAFGQ